MNRILTILLFLYVFNSLNGQHCKISLKEASTDLPVIYANLSWQMVNNSNKRGITVTSNEGTALLPLHSGELVFLSVTCIGYKGYSDTILLKEQNNISLKQDIFNLEQVTVTGTRTPHTLKKAPVLTQLITAEEMNKQGIATIKDVLEQELPGIEMGRHGFGTSMNVQGLEPQYTLILIDGERIAGESGGNIDFSRINISNIEQVEIIRGASSALYGSNAMGGVINIITKKPRKKWDFSFKNQYTQRNEKNNLKSFLEDQNESYLKRFYRRQDLQNLNNDLTAGYKNGEFYTNFYLGYKSYDAYQLYDSESETHYYPHNDSTAIIPVAGLPTQIKGFSDYTVSNKTGFSTGEKSKAEFRASYYNHEEADFTKDGIHDRYMDYTIGGFWDYQPDSVSKIRLSHNFDTYDKYNVLEKLDDKNQLNYRNIFNNTKLIYTLTWKTKHNIQLGAENFSEQLKTDMFIYGELRKESTNDAVIVLQDEYNMFKSLTAVAGLRTGYHSSFHLHASPSLTLRLTKGKFNYRLSYARGYRSPSLKELYMNWDHQGMFIIKGNDKLNPETNDFFAFSTDYLNSDKRVNGTIITSYNHIHDKIDGIWANNQTEYNYVNFETQKVFSGELLVRWKFIRSAGFKGGYAYTRLLMDEEVVNRSGISPHAFTLQLDYQYQSEKYSVGVNISGKITGKKRFSVFDDNSSWYYEVSYPTYSIWNLSVTQKIMNNLIVETGVRNIFNYTAPIVNFNTTASPGRLLFAAITYNF